MALTLVGGVVPPVCPVHTDFIAHAEEAAEVSFTYEISDNQVTITGYDYSVSYDSDWVIPSEIEGLPVTAIGDKAFSRNTFQSIQIPDTVTRIGASAFACCHTDEIQIPDSVTEIGESAFYCCEMQKVRLSANLRRIPDKAFMCCGYLETAVIPEGVKTIGAMAFREYSALQTIKIPDSVTSVEDIIWIDRSAYS